MDALLSVCLCVCVCVSALINNFVSFIVALVYYPAAIVVIVECVINLLGYR